RRLAQKLDVAAQHRRGRVAAGDLARALRLLRERDVQRRVTERVLPAVVAVDADWRDQERTLQLCQRLLELAEGVALAAQVRGVAQARGRGRAGLEQRLVD